MSYLQNLHTHTTYCDGIHTPEEVVLEAIKKGFDSIGFSGHSCMPFRADYAMSLGGTRKYIKEVRFLKEKYKDQIKLFCGLEWDFYSEYDLAEFDYIIGSLHYLDVNGEVVEFDCPSEVVKDIINKYFNGNGMEYAKTYYKQLADFGHWQDVDIVGHFDVITKHSEKIKFFDEESKEYKRYAFEAIESVASQTKLFEVNTGAIARGYRTTPYLPPYMLMELKRRNCGVVISSDCHDKRYLDCHFDAAKKLLLECGFESHYILTDKGFVEIAIE